jgi:hypothetical protein
MQAEGRIVNECLIALSQAGCLAWRNDTGAYQTPERRVIRYGLCKGSSDIIAIAPDGVFVAVECKTAKGRATPEQLRFIAAVQAKGGRAGIARSGVDAVQIALGQ